MKTNVQIHNNAENVIKKSMIFAICGAIEGTDKKLQRYLNKDFRLELQLKLTELGWAGNIYLHQNSKIYITAVKDHIGLCIQTGNVSRIYADLLKLQALYAKGRIAGGIIVLPTKATTKFFGSNAASLERLNRELPIFSDVITIPLVLIGFYE